MLTIREATAADWANIWPLFREVANSGEVFAYDASTSESAARALWATSPSRAFVAELEGAVVGTYFVRPIQPGRGDHIANAGYMVAASARGRGIAHKLCEHSLAAARAMGFAAMQFNFVVSSNAAAVAVWRKCGFREVGRIPRAFRHATLGLVDALVFYRELADVQVVTSASVQEGYDRWAAVYDHDANPLQGLEEPHLRELVGEVRGRVVLDLGCGTGRHALWLARAGATVTAVDFSAGMLAEAQRKPGAESVTFVVHDLHTRLPLESETFDVVVSGLVLEHLRDLGGFFGEVRRLLKVGGRAVISAMHPAMLLRGVQARFTDPESGVVVQPGSLPHGVSDCVMAAVRAGLCVEHLGEHAPDAAFVRRFPRAEKYEGWPMLFVMRFVRG